MRISAKARYGLAAIVTMAEKVDLNQCVTVISLAEKLNISKIYLEQVFSLLKRSGLVNSIKGAQGGYHLARPINEISVYDILVAVEPNLFEKTEKTVQESNEIMEKVIGESVFDALDNSVKGVLSDISLEDIVAQIEKSSNSDNYMFYL